MAGRGLTLPPAAWMHKTRSTNTSENAVIGFFKSSAKSWNRRFVWVEETTLCYGANPGTKEKTFAVEVIASVGNANPKKMKSEGAPDVFVAFGWHVNLHEGKTMTFVCESLADRDAYVAFFTELLQQMQNAHAPGARNRSATLAGAAAPSAQDLSGGGAEPLEFSDDDAEAPAAAPEPAARTLASRAQAAPPAHHGGDDEDGSGEIHGKTQHELRRLTGAGDDDDIDLDDLTYDDEDDLSDDSDMDDTMRTAPQPGGGAKIESADAVYDRILTPMASHTYNHIAYKLDTYKDELKKQGDTVQDVVYSRFVHKIAKKDNVHERDVVITGRNVYFFGKGTFSTNTRVIALDQFVGVIESTQETTLFALIIPSFHDVLLRMVAQKSTVGGSEVDAKQQMIAHIYAGVKRVSQGREFIFREADNVRDLIRRTEEDAHQPLECKPNDRLQTALNPKLYPTFRINAESAVYYSCYVERVNAQMVHSQRIFAITDGGVYLVTADGSRVSKRHNLSEVLQVKYDTDTQGVLVQFLEVDMLLRVRAGPDFEQLVSIVPQIANMKHRGDATRQVNAVPSKTLKSGARLLDAKKLSDHMKKGSASTEEGFKRGVRATQKAIARSLKMTAQGASKIGQNIKAVGKGSVDVLKSGMVNVGGVLVDNALTGELLGAAQSLFQNERILHERCVTLLDEEAILGLAASGAGDTLHLNKTGSMGAAKVTTVYFSARCKRYNITAHIDTHKSVDLVVVVCDRGVLLFEDPSAADTGFLSSAIQRLRSDRGYNLTDKVKWSALRGVVRCESEGNVVGVMTGEDRSSDVMLRLPNTPLADSFAGHIASQYVSMHSPRPNCRKLPEWYTADSVESLKSGLKKTTFDPEPTIALRRHKISDAMGIAVISELVDTIRRHGDNKVLFSGMAWRFRGSSVRKGANKMEKVLDANAHSDKKNFKALILIVTNCAIYQCTKGSFEIARRTEVKIVKKVVTSTEDPDAVLVSVPCEYDLFMRIEGRVKEFVDRLQDAYATWTDYNLYLPHETPKSHDINDYVFKSETADSLVQIGKLDKPPGFADEQARRSANEVRKNYLRFFDRKFHDAMSNDTRPEQKPGGEPITWEQQQQWHAERVVRIRHAVEIAYAFGLRTFDCPPMASAMSVLTEYERRDRVIQQLNAGLANDDLKTYDEAVELSAELNDPIETLIDEQIPIYDVLRQKARVLDAITDVLMDGGDDVELRLRELDTLFADARRLGIKPAKIQAMRVELDETLQRQRMGRLLRNTRNPKQFDTNTRTLLLKTATDLQVPQTIRASIIHGDDPMSDWGALLLESAVDSGNIKTLENAIQTIKADKQLEASLRSGSLAAAQSELQALHDTTEVVSAMQVLFSELRNGINDMDVRTLIDAKTRLESLVAKVTGPHALARYRNIASLYITRIGDRLSVAESLSALQESERAAAAEYRERLRQKAEAEEEARRQAAELEELEERARRRKIMENWASDAERLLYQMKQHVTSDDIHSTTGCVQACEQAAAELHATFGDTVQTLRPQSQRRSANTTEEQAACTEATQEAAATAAARYGTMQHISLEERGTLQPIAERTISTLRTALQVGTLYAERVKARQSKVLPEALIRNIRTLNRAAVMAYIDANQGRGLTTEAVTEIRTEWLKAEADAKWVSQLHHKLHTAVALKSVPMLQAQLEVARSRSHIDAVVINAREWLEAHQRDLLEAGDDVEDSDATAAAEEAEGGTAKAAPAQELKAQPVIYDLMHGWPPRDARTTLITNLRMALVGLLSQQGNTCGKRLGTIELFCKEDPNHPTVRAVVDAWHALLSHRIKPKGLFRKTERTLPDVVAFVGELTRGGDIVSAFCNHLVGEFERVKKLNNSHGSAPSVMLVKYLLQQGDVQRFIDDVFAMLPKEIEDIYYEDAILRKTSEPEMKDIRLMAKMTVQVVWRFGIEDRMADAALLPSRGGAVLEEAELLNADKERRTSARAILSLRKSVTRLSTMFSAEMNKLGNRHDTSALTSLFDENSNKTVGLLVRESLCAAIASVLLVGYRTSHLFVKRHLWDLLEAVSDRLKQSARGLGGVAIPDAVDMIKNLTESDGRNNHRQSSLAKLSDEALADVRTRMFLMHALNQHHLATFLLDAIFEESEANVEFLDKYYHTDKAVLLQAETREEVAKVLALVSELPFVLCVDAEIW